MTFSDEDKKLCDRILAMISDESGMDCPQKEVPSSLIFPRLKIHPCQHRVFIEEKEVLLTNLEFEALHFLARRPGYVFTKAQIHEAVWKRETENYENAVQCVIAGIRKKLKAHTEKEYIQTVRNVGYRFIVPKT